MLRDNDFGIVRLRAFGTYDFKVVEPKTFLKEVAGSDHNFRLDEFSDTMRSRIVSIFTDAIASAKIPVLDVASRYTELGEALLPLINPAITTKYGIEIGSFIVENVSVPPEVEQAIDKRSSMAAVGNLNDFVKYQMAQGIRRRRRRRRGGHGGGTRRGLRSGAADDEGRLHERTRHADDRRCWRSAGGAGRWAAGTPESGRSGAGTRRLRGRRDDGAGIR